MASEHVSAISLEPLFDQAAEPIYLVAPDRTLLYANRACETLTRRPVEQLVGLRCRWHGPVQGGELPSLAGSLCPPPQTFAGKPAGVESLVLHPSGERLRRRIDFFPCRDEQGNLLVILATVSGGSDALVTAEAEHEVLHAELLRLRERLYRRFGLDQIIGVCPAMQRVLEQVRMAAQVTAHVLIVGDRGTGKELLARAVHYQSRRAKAPFVPVDCAALPPETLEQELFGDADALGLSLSPEGGLLAAARGGTICFKEIDALPRDVQCRLATAIGPAAPHRGGSRTDSHDLRVIATTAKNPAALLSEDGLRPDLYYSLTALAIHVPPLKERQDDLPLLAQHFLEAENAASDHQVASIADDARQALKAYDWPGNVSELAATLAAAHARTDGDTLRAEHLPARIRGALGAAYLPRRQDDPPVPLDLVLARVERKLMEMALRRARGNKSQAAELLGISRPRLYRRMELLGMIQVSDEPSSEETTSEDRAVDL